MKRSMLLILLFLMGLYLVLTMFNFGGGDTSETSSQQPLNEDYSDYSYSDYSDI